MLKTTCLNELQLILGASTVELVSRIQTSFSRILGGEKRAYTRNLKSTNLI